MSLDGCLCEMNPERARNISAKAALYAKVVPGSIEWINQLRKEGHKVCIITSRPKRLQNATTKWLEQNSFSFDSLIFGKPVAKKYHYVDDRHVQATRFEGVYTRLVRKERVIRVFG
ncbi:MAG: LNS2 domain-containing protein [Nitrososphaerales archaeon]